MKAQISRLSHPSAPQDAPERSALLHVQGGLITDDTLNTAALSAQKRLEGLGDATFASGAPAQGGCVAPELPALVPGRVIAEGVEAAVFPLPEKADMDWEDKPPDLLTLQRDLRGVRVPTDGRYVIYADVWHRVISPLENPALLDAALHGAESSFETRPIAQLKLLRANNAGGPDFLSDLKKGTGEISAELRSETVSLTTCDPCATEINLEKRLGNGLLRLEVIWVEGDPTNPDRFALAWSSENAALEARADSLPDGFEGPGFVYEHWSPDTEAAKGLRSAGASRVVPDFRDAVNKSHPNPFVRRWDGFAVCTLTSVEDIQGTAAAEIKDGVFTANIGPAKVNLDLVEKTVLAGDYWLIEQREAGDPAEDGGPDGRLAIRSKTPLGIVHHYAPLFRLHDKDIVPLSVTERQRCAVPTLNALPADAVRFDNSCPRLFGSPGEDGAETVQEALDKLCTLNADQIRFDATCDDDTFGAATNVAEALNALCGVKQPEEQRWRADLYDWGVLCGLKVTLMSDGNIAVTKGRFMDWEGQFGDVSQERAAKWRAVDKWDDNATPGRRDLVLGLQWSGTEDSLHLVVGRQATFADGAYLALHDAMAACRDSEKGDLFANAMAKLEEDLRTMANGVLGFALSGAKFVQSGGMNKSEFETFDAARDEMVQSYRDGLTEETLKRLNEELVTLREQINPEAFSDDRQREKFLELATEQMGALLRAGQDDTGCKCDALLLDCAPRPAKALRIPLAYIEAAGSVANPALTEVCMMRARKQALTPRAMAYYLRGRIEQEKYDIWGGKDYTDVTNELAHMCCWGAQQDSDDITILPGTVPWVLNPDDIVLGRGAEQPGRYFHLLDQSQEQATEILHGNGISIAEVINLKGGGLPALVSFMKGAGAAIDISARLTNRELVSAGDSVALLMNGDVAAGYIVVAKGEGQYLFSPDLIAELGGSATLLPKTALPAATPAPTQEVEDLRAQVSGLNAQLHGLQRLLGSLQDEMASVRISARESEPLDKIESDVTLKPEVVGQLKAMGVSTVRDLRLLPDATRSDILSQGLVEPDVLDLLISGANSHVIKHR